MGGRACSAGAWYPILGSELVSLWSASTAHHGGVKKRLTAASAAVVGCRSSGCQPAAAAGARQGSCPPPAHSGVRPAGVKARSMRGGEPSRASSGAAVTRTGAPP